MQAIFCRVLLFHCSVTDHIANGETEEYILANTIVEDGCQNVESTYVYMYITNIQGMQRCVRSFATLSRQQEARAQQ